MGELFTYPPKYENTWAIALLDHGIISPLSFIIRSGSVSKLYEAISGSSKTILYSGSSFTNVIEAAITGSNATHIYVMTRGNTITYTPTSNTIPSGALNNLIIEADSNEHFIIRSANTGSQYVYVHSNTTLKNVACWDKNGQDQVDIGSWTSNQKRPVVFYYNGRTTDVSPSHYPYQGYVIDIGRISGTYEYDCSGEGINTTTRGDCYWAGSKGSGSVGLNMFVGGDSTTPGIWSRGVFIANYGQGDSITVHHHSGSKQGASSTPRGILVVANPYSNPDALMSMTSYSTGATQCIYIEKYSGSGPILSVNAYAGQSGALVNLSPYGSGADTIYIYPGSNTCHKTHIAITDVYKTGGQHIAINNQNQYFAGTGLSMNLGGGTTGNFTGSFIALFSGSTPENVLTINQRGDIKHWVSGSGLVMKCRNSANYRRLYVLEDGTVGSEAT